MDREEARLLLSCYHPEDVPSLEMVEALRVALQDPELGAWLVNEQRENRMFVDAIAQWEVPEALYGEILQDRLTLTRDEVDEAMSSIMESIPLPEQGAAKVLAAMRQTKRRNLEPKRGIWKNFAWISAVAAGIVAGAFFTPKTLDGAKPESSLALQSEKVVPLAKEDRTRVLAREMTQIRNEFVQTVSTHHFALQTRDPMPEQMLDHLREKGMPAPHCCACLPKRLREIQGIGCGKISLEGKNGSIMCFQDGPNVVHLAVFAREDFPDVAVKTANEAKDREIIHDHEWSTAVWGDEKCLYFLIGPAEANAVNALETYF